jgi:Domain of unknown function (DUF4349)
MKALHHLLFTSLLACSHPANDDTRGPTDQPAGPALAFKDNDRYRLVDAVAKNDDGQTISKVAAGERKVIHTGRVELVVAAYDTARAKIEALLAQSHGYIDSTNVNHHAGEVSDATLVVRIPADGLGSILPKLREIGEIVSESTAASDITEQYVDVEARLASKKTLEKRLLELAANPNGNISDVLAVERELANVRGEIEGYEGQIRQWKDRIAMTTLTLQLSTKRPEIVAAAPPSLGERISDGFHGSLTTLRDAGTWLAVHTVAVLPWLVLAIPGFVFARRMARRVKLPWAIARKVTPVEPAANPTSES